MTPRLDIARQTTLAARWADDIAARIHATLRNLDDHMPGFPATTPGSGSVGGGGSSTASRTEALALDGLARDDALRDRQDLIRAVGAFYASADLLHTLTARWGYRTTGEWNPAATSPQAKPTEHEVNAGRWCTSCARVHVMEPVGTKGRSGLCRWCYDFQSLHVGKLPTHGLLDAHHRGVKITEAMIRAEMSAPSTVHQGKRKAKA
jgi:hypothetical protein